MEFTPKVFHLSFLLGIGSLDCCVKGTSAGYRIRQTGDNKRATFMETAGSLISVAARFLNEASASYLDRQTVIISLAGYTNRPDTASN